MLAMRLHESRFKDELNDRKGDIFVRCVDLFRPVCKSIKKMNNKEPHSAESLKYLVRLGNHITQHITHMMKQ